MIRQEHSAKKGQLALYGALLAVVVGCMVALSLCDRPKMAVSQQPSGGDTLDIAINAAAHMGVIWKSIPNSFSTPAARGKHNIL